MKYRPGPRLRIVCVDYSTVEHKPHKAVYDWHLVADLEYVPGVVTVLLKHLEKRRDIEDRSDPQGDWFVLDEREYPHVWEALNKRRKRDYGQWPAPALTREDLLEALRSSARISDLD